MVQLLEEPEYQYVMRCIEIRQKVILASNKSDIKFDKELVRKLFHRTLERGCLSSYVMQEIKPLKRNNASDKDLIAAVTKASTTEKERNLVQGKLCVCIRLVAHEIDQVKQKWIIRLILWLWKG